MVALSGLPVQGDGQLVGALDPDQEVQRFQSVASDVLGRFHKALIEYCLVFIVEHIVGVMKFLEFQYLLSRKEIYTCIHIAALQHVLVQCIKLYCSVVVQFE